MTDLKINPIDITDKAKEQINNALKIKGIPENYFLRIGLRGGACSATYFIGFDKMEDNDELHQINNLNIGLLIKKPHLMYLMGVELDFEEEGNGYTFNKL
ncbi:iron-sulfur cluster assembly protein [Arcicella aurantiaca]|jgi:iron-sulfur cluster assembly protein|uniref:Iron-sulfur cluster assembly protein n=1 Tax=Arcicella aurantiaca TaxID=591202 RepID=A0A316E9M8_9BACT|nr:iron-sulfur cluster biosynthesis family protein [Arcicella aurantiaca]PWK26669.1 iron-sulfur cluster assembly protein [Arcicella aurantiaca]